MRAGGVERATRIVVALAAAACRPSEGRGATAEPEGGASVAVLDVAAPRLPDSARPPTATFSLFTPDNGEKRRLASGTTVWRIDADGGASPVSLPSATTTADGQEMTTGPIDPGHYRARFLVALCAPRGACKAQDAGPEDVEFDVPAAGSVEVTIP